MDHRQQDSTAATAVLTHTDTEIAAFDSAQDNREFPRFPFRGRAHAIIYPPAGDDSEPEELEILTTDLSRRGVSVLHRRQLVPGQHILLVLCESKRLVEVRWSCRVWSGLYAAGCCFVSLEDNAAAEAAARSKQ